MIVVRKMVMVEVMGLWLDGGVLEKVQQFCYLGDVVDCEARVEKAVTARVADAW